MASGRGRAEERGGDDGGDGSDEEDLKWRRVRRRTESSDDDDDGEVREDNDDPSVSSAGAEFGDDSDGLGAAPEPEDEASPYCFDELDVGDGEDEDEGEGASRTVEFAAMAAERQMSSAGEEDKEQSERDQKEREAVAVPRCGAFFMHDDRISRRGRGRQNYGAGRLIEHDEGKWQHDKFEEIQGSYDKKAMDHISSRIVRGRGPIKYPLARPYSRYPPKENAKAWMSRETRSNSGRALAEASSQVGSSVLKKEVSASYVNCAARMDNPTISTFSHAISSLTKRDVQKRNTEGDSPKSVLSKTDPSMKTAFASRLVRGLSDSTGRDQHPSNELIRENNLESVQWQGQGTGLPFSPQHTYQHPATSPNGGALMINNHVLPQTSFNNSFPPYFGGCSPEYTLFGSPSRALLPSASEIGTLLVSAGLNTELIHPAADRQLAFLPLQPVMTWANSPQSLQWNLSPSSQHVYQYTGSNQNGGALMMNNLVIPQTPFGNSFQPQFHGYGQHLYSPSGSSSVFDNSEMAMAGRVSAADGSYGRTYSGLDTHTNQNFTTTENLVPVNQVTSQHHGELGEIGISNVPAYFAAEPNFGSSASGLAWPQVWPANAGSVSSAYPSSTHPTPTTSANRCAKPTEPESSLTNTGSVTTQFVNFHEGSNPVDGSEMPNTSRGEGGNKLQRYTKMNFDDRRK